MCRLFASRGIPPGVIDRLLLVNQTDGGHGDGWGITDGTASIFKSERMYSESVPAWMGGLNMDRPILAHLRKASSGTGKTVDEAHPYMFDIHGSPLYCAHNGQLNGTDWQLRDKGPNTDSWRAFYTLADRVRESPEDLNGEMIENWINTFNTGSQFAMLFYYNDMVYALRHDRDLFYTNMMGGWMVNTSRPVLFVMQKYVETVLGQTIEDKTIHELPRDSFSTFNHSGILATEQLSISFKVYGYQGNYKDTTPPANNAKPNTQTTDIIPVNEPVTNSSAGAITPPRKKNRRREESSTGETNLELWKRVFNAATPLPRALTAFWFEQLMGYDIPLREDKSFLAQVIQIASTKDVEFFLNIVKRVRFTPRQNMLINAWNHAIGSGDDIAIHKSFMSQPFWTHPDYLAESINGAEVTDNAACSELLGNLFDHAIENPDLYATSGTEFLRKCCTVIDTMDEQASVGLEGLDD